MLGCEQTVGVLGCESVPVWNASVGMGFRGMYVTGTECARLVYEPGWHPVRRSNLSTMFRMLLAKHGVCWGAHCQTLVNV